MLDITAKTIFVTELARAMAMPLPVVRQRIRAMFIAGIGPARNQPLTYLGMADYLIGFIAAPTHLESPDVARRFGAFHCVGVAGERATVKALSSHLPIDSAPFREVLAALLRVRAEDAPIHVLDITAAWPPHDGIRLRLTTGNAPPVELRFGGQVAVRKRLKPATAWPLQHEVRMEGHAIDALARLDIASPDPTTSEKKRARRND